ncbi:uncharacterized protein LOC110461478 [Mizuhopecten yessoensis]|uniref:uncharacterized protein LOC110461478 n=1 Tax=Mizuhopecten yessoensis TaxID=6573 RepID=UPI000B45F5AB|nr:uncharacterized protein LOC110461478 [Mizuhopecten yessoensis]
MGNLKSKLKRSKSKSRKSGHVNLPDSSSSRKTVDPRLPFGNYRQVFSIRNAWKNVMRTMEDTAKDHLIRFFERFPAYKENFSDIKDLQTDDAMRESLEFETRAVDIFQMFDDVIANLESVDIGLEEIHRVAASGSMTVVMVKDMKSTFMETLRHNLSDRLTDTTSENFNMLYDFIVAEMEKAC